MASQAATSITAYLTGRTPMTDLLKSAGVGTPDALAHLERRILAHLGTEGPATRQALRKALGASADEVDAALASLRDDKLITGGVDNRQAKLVGH